MVDPDFHPDYRIADFMSAVCDHAVLHLPAGLILCVGSIGKRSQEMTVRQLHNNLT